ncbi:MAG: anaerobic ribonucleoside-triphosphate reductase activating protein [Enterocloster asparagiformis]|nr:anaerobic ribonucleoside-triphosphate reductase activating protein [Enterocloster asparagiformis]
MKICGLQKTTLLDFPGHVAATIFTGGCNFRCPFCHNSELLSGSVEAEYETEEVLEFLAKRRGILEGVCITGGEPTLQPDLEDFIRRVRDLGLLVKLDTNGYKPELMKNLCEKGLLDFVAMDIKAGRSSYTTVAGVDGMRLERIDESIRFLLSGGVPYEFRTTAVKGLHTEKDFREIGPWIEGCEKYYLQNFTESGQVLEPGVYAGFEKEELERFAAIVKPYVGEVALRGIDY